jgi:hypothetical protein
VAQTYTIIIDEDQRLLLVTALARLGRNLDQSDADEADRSDLLDMLRDLPEQESESPGVHHGLCL